jgi:chitinase
MWGAVTGASKYVLQRRLQGDSTFATVSDAITATTFTDAGLSPSTNYEYQLMAVDAGGVSSAPTAPLAVSTPTGVPAPPAFSSTDPSLAEPKNGTADMTFTVSLSAAANQAISLDYSTVNGSALAGSDFTATSGSITFAPGETSKTIIVPIKADSVDEPAEMFTLSFTLTGGSATLSDQAAQGTILPATSTPTPTPTTPTPTPTGTPIPFGGKTVANVQGFKVTLKGPGNGTATVRDDGTIDIDVTGSTSASALSVTGKGTAQLGDVMVNGSLKSFTGKTADLRGNFNLTGTLGKLTAHDTHNARTLTIGGSGAPVSIALASASDLSVNSASPIKSIKAAAWLDTDNAVDTITTPALSSLSVKGNMTADVVAGLLGKVSVGGAIQGATIRSDGDIASIRAGAMHDSAVYAGVRSDLTGMPTAVGDFVHDALIKSLSVSGKTAGSFSDTVIAAQDLGKISLGSVTTANNGTPFGVAADRIASVSSTLGAGGKVSLKKLDAPADSQTQDDFNLRLI